MTATTEIIPKLEFDSPLELALATNDTFHAKLAPLHAEALSAVIRNKEDYERVGAILSEKRSIRKNEVAPLWAPFSGLVNRVRDFIKLRERAVDNLCEAIDGICTGKMKEY